MTPESTRQPTILHVDMDAFFVSIELLHHPEHVGKPVVVGGLPNSRGVVCSASYEARKFGIHSAMPCFKAFKLCPHAIFLPGRFSEYGDYSRQIRSIFESFSPTVEMASQDEAYIDLAGTERILGSPLKLAAELRRTVLAETGLPCSIGIGRNKLVAKIASGLCKPKGLLWVPTGSEVEFLSRLPVGKIPGVGTEMQRTLKSFGIEWISELLASIPAHFPSPLSRRIWELQERCTCRRESPVVPQRDIKSVSHERTFETNIDSLEALENYVSWLAEKVATRLRVKELKAKTIGIKLKYADFQSRTVEHTVAVPTDDAGTICKVGQTLLRERWQRERPLRLIGVYASGFDAQTEQLELFTQLEAPELKPKSLDRVLDQIREKHGFNSVLRGGSKIA